MSGSDKYVDISPRLPLRCGELIRHFSSTVSPTIPWAGAVLWIDPLNLWCVVCGIGAATTLSALVEQHKAILELTFEPSATLLQLVQDLEKR